MLTYIYRVNVCLQTSSRFTTISMGETLTKLLSFFKDLHVQQTPKPFAHDPEEVPPLFVHSDLQIVKKIFFYVDSACELFLLLLFNRSYFSKPCHPNGMDLNYIFS